MRNFLLFLILGVFLTVEAFSITKFSEVQKALKEDNYGRAIPEMFSPLISKKATNPVSVSDFSIVGNKSIMFELNNGECGFEKKFSDCENDRERSEILYEEYPSKNEVWYQFYIFLPKDYNSVAPSKMSLIQWKRLKPSKVLVMFQHTHAGLTFNRNGDTFENSQVMLKSNEDLFGNWTQIIFNTNWHPDPKQGFMRVWIDGELKVDFKGVSNDLIKGKKQSLRYGLYNSFISRYKNTFGETKMPKRVVFFDGIRSEKKCEKLLNKSECKKLEVQNVEKYKIYKYKKHHKRFKSKHILEVPKSFLK